MDVFGGGEGRGGRVASKTPVSMEGKLQRIIRCEMQREGKAVMGRTYHTEKESAGTKVVPENSLIFKIPRDPACGFVPNGGACS